VQEVVTADTRSATFALKLDPDRFEYKLSHPYVHKKKHQVHVIIAHREFALLTCSAKVEHDE